MSDHRPVIVGAYEHPRREMPEVSVAQIHAQVAWGALNDAGLGIRDVDAYICAGDAPGFGPLNMISYLGLRCSHLEGTEMGGASYVSAVGHAAAAIASGKCHVVLVTLGGKARSGANRPGVTSVPLDSPDATFDQRFGLTTVAGYALAARRHMYQFGTTSEQLAAIKVAAATHAQHNPHALFRNPVSVTDVVSSPMIADPLHRLDCCVVTDGGGAIVVASSEVARELPRRGAKVLGHGEAAKYVGPQGIDLTYTAARWSGSAAFSEAGLSPADIDYASIYDSFTITVLISVEDLGFCPKGDGGRFVEDGGLIAPEGRLPFNTDGGGLCNNHPTNRGGMTKIIEAVRQIRGEAHPALQVRNCETALVHATGGSIGTRMVCSTLILGQADA